MISYAWLAAMAAGTMIVGQASAATIVTSSNYQVLVGSHATATTSTVDQGNESKGNGTPQKLTKAIGYSTYASATTSQGRATAYASNYTSLTPGAGDQWTVRMTDDNYAALTNVDG